VHDSADVVWRSCWSVAPQLYISIWLLIL